MFLSVGSLVPLLFPLTLVDVVLVFCTSSYHQNGKNHQHLCIFHHVKVSVS